MNILSFDNGFKELVINGDKTKVIKFNPCDYELIKRAEGLYERLDKAFKEIENKDADILDKISEKDAVVRREIDFLLNSDVSNIVFGKTNCLSISNGKYIFENFLTALMKYIEESIKEEEQKSNDIVKKYVEQVKK